MQRVVRDYDQEFPALAPQPKQSQHEIEKEEQEKQQRIIADKKAQEERKVEREQELAELNQEFEDIEYAEGKTLYKSIKGKLCDVNVWKRVLREVRDVNRDFHSLRAHIGIVADTIGALHFLLYPSDGAIADKPLCGRILIPREYPKIPPVMHMSTRTNRYNVDVFNSYSKSIYLKHMQSSMCFDLLKLKEYGGTWEPEFTLSALIASVLQAIVSIKVPQMYGGEVIEYVTMEKLSSVHKNVESTYRQIKSFMPSPKVITHIEPMEVRTKYFRLPDKITSPPSNSRSLIIKSNPIFLQGPSNKMKDNVYSIGFDLSDLKSNPATVFSIILSNSPFDPVGNKPETILVRNGVTATAAKKRFDKPIEWFYHGKPMNESDLRVIVTVGYNQFCISYYVDGDRKVIHGDCPVSFLTPAEIGNVDKQSFYLSVFLKNKRGQSITVKTFIPESGCVHPVAADIH